MRITTRQTLQAAALLALLIVGAALHRGVSAADAETVEYQIKATFIFGLPDASWGDVRRTFKFFAKAAAAGCCPPGRSCSRVARRTQR